MAVLSHRLANEYLRRETCYSKLGEMTMVAHRDEGGWPERRADHGTIGIGESSNDQ